MVTSPFLLARDRKLLACVAAVAFAGSASPVAASAQPVRVELNGSVISVRNGATVADALELAGIRLRVGVMRAAATGNPVEGYMDEPVVVREGRRVGLRAKVIDGERLEIEQGTDWREPTETRRVVRHGTPLPDVETRLWHQAHDGVVEQVVGVHSGEVVSEREIEPAAPAAPSSGREIVLTFDDGPDPRWTPAVLDILAAKGAKAVFCMVGSQMRRHPGLVRRVASEGHVLCNHTDNHDVRIGSRPDAVMRANIDSVTNLMVELTGLRPRFYRAPGGNITPNVITYVRNQGMRVLGWSIDPADYRKPGAATILQRITSSVQPAGVTLLHDAGGDRSQTVQQLPALIDQLRAASYTVAVP